MKARNLIFKYRSKFGSPDPCWWLVYWCFGLAPLFIYLGKLCLVLIKATWSNSWIDLSFLHFAFRLFVSLSPFFQVRRPGFDFLHIFHLFGYSLLYLIPIVSSINHFQKACWSARILSSLTGSLDFRFGPSTASEINLIHFTIIIWNIATPMPSSLSFTVFQFAFNFLERVSLFLGQLSQNCIEALKFLNLFVWGWPILNCLLPSKFMLVVLDRDSNWVEAALQDLVLVDATSFRFCVKLLLHFPRFRQCFGDFLFSLILL